MAAKKVSVSMPCPVCQGAMNVRELECPECSITVRGNFGAVGASAATSAGTRYDNLTPEQATFLETFLRCRGIIRDMEAALGISYPTVRSRLDSLLGALGLADTPPGQPARGNGAEQAPAAPAAPAAPEKPQASVKDILAQLDSGNIDAQAALDALRGSRTDS